MKNKKSIKLAVPAPKPRNRVAQNPLLRKGGAHQRARSGERFASKQQARKAAREWKGSRDARLAPCPAHPAA
ncbi:hypothetical protein [Microbulbifer sp. SAOS-129_SWC]|uniref:hypothetical protein n=1 Tax=Microbulbifer sp. SAOS-129_SWC TaxID=3145235 RepID=UPI0032165A2B